MIYELLLIQNEGIVVPSDIFARRDYGRTGSRPCACVYCGDVFLSDHGCLKHTELYHRRAFLHGGYSHGGHSLQPMLPEVSTSLLQTCHIIRLEASPILYSRNAFQFSDPATASNFRWSTDCAQASAIQEIQIKFGSQYYKRVTRWMTYFTKRTLSLGQDFPNLRRMTMSLDCWVGLESAHLLRRMSEGFRERSRGLDWVLVSMLNDEKLLDCFEPLVDKGEDSRNGNKKVQNHVWTDEGIGVFWKHALLWWGSPGEVVPHKYRSMVDQRQPKQRTSTGVEESSISGNLGSSA